MQFLKTRRSLNLSIFRSIYLISNFTQFISEHLPIESKWMAPTFDWFLSLTVATRRIKTIWPRHTFGPDHKQPCVNPNPRHSRDVSENIINHDWLSERYHDLVLHVVRCHGPLRIHKNSFGALLGSPLLHLSCLCRTLRMSTSAH